MTQSMKEVHINCKVESSRVASLEKLNVRMNDRIFGLKKQLVDFGAKMGSWRRSLPETKKCQKVVEEVKVKATVSNL